MTVPMIDEKIETVADMISPPLSLKNENIWSKSGSMPAIFSDIAGTFFVYASASSFARFTNPGRSFFHLSNRIRNLRYNYKQHKRYKKQCRDIRKHHADRAPEPVQAVFFILEDSLFDSAHRNIQHKRNPASNQKWKQHRKNHTEKSTYNMQMIDYKYQKYRKCNNRKYQLYQMFFVFHSNLLYQSYSKPPSILPVDAGSRCLSRCRSSLRYEHNLDSLQTFRQTACTTHLTILCPIQPTI